MCGSQHINNCHSFLSKGMLYRRVSVERNAVQTGFCSKECCTDRFLLKGMLYRWFLFKGMLYRRVSVETNAVQTSFCSKECCIDGFLLKGMLYSRFLSITRPHEVRHG